MAAIHPRTESGEWVIEAGVRCVVCPGCAFTFDADHTDVDGGGYSCPECGEGGGKRVVVRCCNDPWLDYRRHDNDPWGYRLSVVCHHCKVVHAEFHAGLPVRGNGSERAS